MKSSNLWLLLEYWTRSQAVARIADRTAKIVVVTWPRPRPLSGQGNVFVHLLGIAHTKPCIKFEVSSSSSFKDTFNRMPKIVGVTWSRPRPRSGKIICALAFPIQSRVPNLKSLAQVVFEILRSKCIGVTSLTFQGHVASSVTWPFDSPYAISYWWSFGNQASICNGFRDIQRQM